MRDELQGALQKLLVFNRLDLQLQRKIVQEMYERRVEAGEILIKEGDTGLAATELYVVKSGKFEVSRRTRPAAIWPQSQWSRSTYTSG
jgi:cGMP-dependent protein kinase 2